MCMCMCIRSLYCFRVVSSGLCIQQGITRMVENENNDVFFICFLNADTSQKTEMKKKKICMQNFCMHVKKNCRYLSEDRDENKKASDQCRQALFFSFFLFFL